MSKPPSNEFSSMEQRKSEHIEICLNEQVAGRNISTGLEQYRFWHRALPEMNFESIDISTSFLNKPIKAPFIISSMTGGAKRAAQINRLLATVAEERGWAMGVGSVRAAVENEALSETFKVRDYAPSIPIISNIGAVQLNYGFGTEQCQRAVDLVQADALVLHLNAMQEVFQPEGNTNFSGLLKQIEQLCKVLPVPIGVKEVGWGIDGATARQLLDVGVQFIDVAGAGGTSWSQVEKFRLHDPLRKAAAEAFADWGIPTADCIRDVRAQAYSCVLIGSGGLYSGVDAAKAIGLGADLAGFGRALLGAAVENEEQVFKQFEQLELELRLVMFGIGAAKLSDLKNTPLLKRKER